MQSVTWLTTDVCLTAVTAALSLIPARFHTFVKIDHEIISTVILLPSVDSFKKGCSQLQAESMCMKYWLTACSSLPRKGMIIAVDWDIKHQTKKNIIKLAVALVGTLFTILNILADPMKEQSDQNLHYSPF